MVAMDELSLIREGSFRVKISGRDVSNILLFVEIFIDKTGASEDYKGGNYLLKDHQRSLIMKTHYSKCLNYACSGLKIIGLSHVVH